MKKLIFIIIALLFQAALFSQTAPFTIELESVSIPGAPRVHSFAFAQSGGKWLIIGGRTNGLHGFNFGFSFQPKYQNRYAWVIDPAANQVWSANLYTSLSIAKADPLRSMNMQYYQDGDKLFMAGGYGLDSLKDSLVTFPVLSSIDINAFIQAVISGTSLNSHVRQLTDERLRVCGAEMDKLGDYTYLPGGHNFWGEYTRTINNQVYTNSIKKFKIVDNGASVSITDYTNIVDTVNYHRRDYNLVHAIRPNGDLGLTLYGGVFKYNVDLPFQEPIYIDQSGITVDNSFQQLMTQYTTANFLMYDSVTYKMHTTFLGGTSLYYYDEGSNSLIKDTLVPFIKDISTLTREQNGSSSEFVHPVRFTSLVGTNAIFIQDPNVPHYSNGVIKLASLNGRTFIGYMFGGIKALFANNGSSSASDQIYKIYADRNPYGIEPIGTVIPQDYSLEQNYPNPFNPNTSIIFSIPKKDFVSIKVYDVIGRKVKDLVNEELSAGKYSVEFDLLSLSSGVYFYSMVSSGFTQTKRMILVK